MSRELRFVFRPEIDPNDAPAVKELAKDITGWILAARGLGQQASTDGVKTGEGSHMNHEEYTQAVADGRWPAGCRVPEGTTFEDDRGYIDNVLTQPTPHVSVLFSRKGSVRANHWHRTDAHYSRIVHGKVLYFERPIGSTEIPVPKVFADRQTFWTRPELEHAMLFAEDTFLVTMARNIRLHEQHEQDVVRVPFITPELAETYLALERERIRVLHDGGPR